MKADYKNWMPKGMVLGTIGITACRVYQTFGFIRWACMS